MNESGKWIKLHSKILNWEWYKNSNVFRLFLHCLLKANWKDGKFQGKEILRGSFVTSLETLSQDTCLSVQQIRTALTHLISTGELTSKSYAKFRVITVINYELYQQVNKETNNQITSNQQADNKQVTTIVDDIDLIDDIDFTSTPTNAHTREENLFECIERIFGRAISSSEYEVIGTWEDNQVTRYAIRQAELARAFNVKYIQRILNAYKKENIRTVAEAEERERKFQESKTTVKNIQKENTWEEEFLKSD